MDSTLEFLTKQISILQNDADPNDAEFVCYKLGQNDKNTKSYAVNQLAQGNAVLISHRAGIYEHGYGIAYIDDDTPCLMHDIAFEEFIDVLGNKELSSEHLAVMIKNCTTDQQIKILSHLENKKLHAIIKNNNIINQLVF